MKLSLCRYFLLLVGLFCDLGWATPMSLMSSLPINEVDIKKIQTFVKNDPELVKQFLSTLTQLRVFPDHQNPSKPADIADRGKTKVFWAPPMLSASEERATVGALGVAKHALSIIDEFEKLVSVIDVDVRRVYLLNERIEEKHKRASELSKKPQEINNDLLNQSVSDQIHLLNTQVDVMEKTINRIKNDNVERLVQQPQRWIIRVVDEMVRQFSRLGVTPNPTEQEQLYSNNPTKINLALATLRARVARGQFAIQQVVLEAGLNGLQHDVFGYYLSLRPDVQIKTLPSYAIFARSAVQESVGIEENADGGLPKMIRAINQGAKEGSCGASSTCNVVMEYTEMGARWVQGATTGVVLMPVTFEAMVEYEKPAFKGDVKCNFQTAFVQKGRLDIRDGAFVYDRDVTDTIKHSSLENGTCKISMVGGDFEDAQYHLLKKIHDDYLQIRSTRAQKSNAQMNAEANHINAEIKKISEDLKRRPARNDTEVLISGLVNVFATGGLSLAAAVVAIGDQFYWHTKILDRQVSDHVHIQDSFDFSKKLVRELRGFDAFPVVCWRHHIADGQFVPFPAACSNTMLLQETPNTVVGTTQKNCGADRTPFSQCGDDVNQAVSTNTFGERVMAT
jgi:hypothetical protein